MAGLQQVAQNVEHDAVNSEKYIKDLSKVCWQMIRHQHVHCGRERGK